MARIDHVAVESDDPDGIAAFYERVFGARIVKIEGHPVVAYLGNTGLALHASCAPGSCRHCVGQTAQAPSFARPLQPGDTPRETHRPCR